MAYTKTNWQDLPSTNTPINATNLNKMEQGIYDANDKNIAVISLKSNFVITTGSTYLKLNGLTQDLLLGNKLSVNNSSIIIGEGVHHIRVYFSTGYYAGSANSRIHIRVGKNNETDTLSWRYVTTSQSDVVSLSGENICAVTQGDAISLYYYSVAGNQIEGNEFGARTSLIVEVID